MKTIAVAKPWVALDVRDQRFVDEAEGWLGLGSVAEAGASLNEITPGQRIHPEVLGVFWRVYAAAKKWDHALTIAEIMVANFPKDETWILNRALALRRLDRTAEAYGALSLATRTFRTKQNKWLMRYRLACYASVLGKLNEAEKNLHRAIDLVCRHNVRLMAIQEPDLAPLLRIIPEI